MTLQSDETKRKLQNRLKRIEGQARGVQRMLDEDRECREILQQLMAIQSAVKTATDAFLQAYARDCLLDLDSATPVQREETVDELLTMLARVR